MLQSLVGELLVLKLLICQHFMVKTLLFGDEKKVH